MVYKQPRHKILIFLIIMTFAITLISGYAYWKMWSILPITFTIFYMVGKSTFNFTFILFAIIIKCMLTLFNRSNVYERKGLSIRAKLHKLERCHRTRLLSDHINSNYHLVYLIIFYNSFIYTQSIHSSSFHIIFISLFKI